MQQMLNGLVYYCYSSMKWIPTYSAELTFFLGSFLSFSIDGAGFNFLLRVLLFVTWFIIHRYYISTKVWNLAIMNTYFQVWKSELKKALGKSLFFCTVLFGCKILRNFNCLTYSWCRYHGCVYMTFHSIILQYRLVDLTRCLVILPGLFCF